MSVETLGNYELEGLLGEGGIGQVYAAQDKVLGRRVAIKSLRPELSRDRSFVDRFYNEAKSLANLNHTNITTLYALHVEGSEAFMVMELVHGQTIEALLARVGRLTLRDALAVLAQAVPGIRYAHRRGIIHRDLKPANMMLTDDGVVKIMDFGIARVQGSQHLTRVGEFCGTFVYASPEQIRGEDVDERSDLYSLAIVLYRMLAGTAPFMSDNEYALMTAQLQTPPPPLAGRVPDLDADTEAVLMRALAKRPEDRYASVEEFGRAIGAMALRGESVDLLQQLYAHVFEAQDPEATRIISSRHIPVVEPTLPSSPPAPRQTVDWQLPPSLAGRNIAAGPQSEPRTPGRRSVLAETQVAAPSLAPTGTRSSYRWRWLGGAAALILPLLLAGGYFVVSPGVPTPPSLSQQRPPDPTAAPSTAASGAPHPETPPAPVVVAAPERDPKPSPSPAPTVETTKTDPAVSSPTAPGETAKKDPPPPAEVSKQQPSPPSPVAADREPPPPAPPVRVRKQEPPPPAPVDAARHEPPPPAPAETAKKEPVPPPPPPPPAPVEVAKQEPPPSAPVETARKEPASPPAPAPVKVAKQEPPPSAPVETGRKEPASPPAPAPVEVAKQEPPQVPVAAPNAQAGPAPEPVGGASSGAKLAAAPPSAAIASAGDPALSPSGTSGGLVGHKPDPAPPNAAAAMTGTGLATSSPASSSPVTVAKNEPPPAAEPGPPLGPPPAAAPLHPEGEPDLQGRVTGAKRLDEIEVGARWIKIYGIVDRARGAQEQEHVRVLVRYLKSSQNHLVCYRKATDTYRCYSDGQDIARLALQDGMVQLAPNAPAEYRSLLTGRR